MRKKIAVASAVTLILLFFIFLTMKNKTMNYVFAILLFIAGLGVGYSIHKPANTVKYMPSAIVYKDTCIESKIICQLTTTDSLSIYNIVRKGKLKTQKTKPNPEKVDTVTITIAPECSKNTYTKVLDNGFTKVFDTLLVKGEILDWSRAYQMDTLQIVKEVIRTTTSVVKEEKPEDKIEELTESSKRNLHLGLSTGINYNQKYSFLTGLNLQNDLGSLALTVNPRTLKEVQVSLNLKLLKLRSQ